MVVKKSDKKVKTNQDITSKQVRLVNAKGETVGVVELTKALAEAKAHGLDLVEVVPDANPPVCKIIDYGKYRYAQKKRVQDSKKKQKSIQIKEVKIRHVIEENDYQVKLKNMRRFIDAGNKVKVSMRFRGRENMHNEIGFKVFNRVIEDLGEAIKIDTAPKLDGRQIIMNISPLPTK